MNTSSEDTIKNGNQRRKSIGSGGGLNLAGGKTRRQSIGVTSSQKSIVEEGNIIPNYLRASTGSCHDFCKFGKKHENSKSAIPIKFKRTTVINKDKLPKTVVSLEKKNTNIKPFTKPVIQTPDEPVKKSQVNNQSSSTNGKTTKNEFKTLQRVTSVVKLTPVVVVGKKDIKTVKKTGIAPKTGSVKKVVAKVTSKETQSPKGYFGKDASLKAIKSNGVKKVSPLKDQNRKTEQTVDDNNVQLRSLHGVEAESEVKHETMEFDFSQPSMDLVNPPVCNSSDSFSDKNVEEDSPVVHLVNESSELFSDKEVVEELNINESSQFKSCLDKEILENEAFIAPTVSESPESFYDDEVLENESDYTDDEEDEVSKDGSQTANFNNNHNIPKKGKMVISEDKDEEAVKLRFRRGKILDLQTENNGPRRLKFKRRVIAGDKDVQMISRKTYKNKTLDLQNEDKQRASRKMYEKKHVEETNDMKNDRESVVLKHQGEQEKKDDKGLLNNVIEETASKLVESRKSKVKALVGAFETVISLQDGKPLST